MKNAFIILLIAFSPFVCVRSINAGPASVRSDIIPSRPPATISEVSISYHDINEVFTMLVQTDGVRPEVSEPITWGLSGIVVTFFDSVLSDDFLQGDAARPVMAYRIGADGDNIVLRISFLSYNVATNIIRNSAGTDIFLEFRENPTKPAITQAAGFVGSTSDNSSDAISGSSADPTDPVLTSAVISSRSDANMPASDSSVSFRDALLTAARALSQDSKNDNGNSERSASVAQTGPQETITSAERWRLDTIVLDAGHGGWDTGAVSRAGLKEKDLSLSVSTLLGAMLEENLGVNVEYTRLSDVFVPLANRGHIANVSGGKLFISIHANQSKARSARGTETYFLGIHRSDSARVVMERENEVVELEEDSEAYQRMDDGEIATRRLTQSAYMQQSEKLAALIQSGFTTTVGRKNRGVKQAGFYVLFGASMPAVLIELGFMSNTREAGFLSTNDGQQQMAVAIFQAVKKFKNDYEKALNVTKL